jgi:hypothetical protein
MADGWAIATQFAGADLGAQINAAFAAGYQAVEVPPNSGLVISTTVNIPHGATIRFTNRYPNHIVCSTNDKPVFQAISSSGIRHFRIQGGIFDGAAVNTPLCFLMLGRTTGAVGQTGDTTCMDNVQCTGNWGAGVVINIGGEVDMYSHCHLWVQGDGDSVYAGTRATVIIANKDHFSFVLTAALPGPVTTAISTTAGSTSAHVFQNCDIRCDANSSCFLLKGQVEDTTIIGTYINSPGTCAILLEAGDNGGGTWTCPRRLYIGGGGRFETQGLSGGCPFVLVDGKSQAGMGVYNMTLGEIGLFIGSSSNSMPALKTQNAGLMYALDVKLGHHLEYSNVLLDHQTADLSWAHIESRFNAAVNCTGKTIDHSFIRCAGAVSGTLGTLTVAVHSGGTDWTM